MNTKSAYPSSVVKGIPRLGRKPEGWREVAFGDVLEVVKRPATIDPDQSYQLINVRRNRGGVIPRETKRGSEIKTQTQFYVAADDFVISRRQIVHGACGIVPPKLDGALVSNEYSTLIPKNGLHLKFLAYFSHTSHFQKTCFHASVGVVIEKMIFNLDAWLRHRFYLPPLEEQELIVRILAAADRAIACTEDLIAAKRKIKEGLAQQLLTGKRRLPGFTESWRDAYLRNLCVMAYGKSQKGVDSESGCFPIFGTGGVVGLTNKALHPGPAIILGRKGSIDRPYLASGPFWAIDTTFYAVPAEDVSVEWLYQKFRTIRWRRFNEATGVPSLSRDNLYRIRLKTPSRDEQERIATVIGAVDRSLEILEQKLASFHYLKHGLMQKLLPSEPRVEAS